VKVVTREAMERLRAAQALDVAIESVERDLDRACWSFSEAMSLHGHLRKLRALRSEIGFDEANERDEESPVR